MDGYMAEIRLFAGNFAPRNWHFCDGSLLPINQYQALYSLIGNTYGGDGRTNFALPDLRGRVPISAGRGPGLSNYVRGQMGGEERHTLNINEMPSHTHNGTAHTHPQTAHTHPANASEEASQEGPSDGFWAPSGEEAYGNSSDITMNANAVGSGGDGNTGSGGNEPTSSTGGNQAHNNMQPYLSLNYIICLEGMYPDRN